MSAKEESKNGQSSAAQDDGIISRRVPIDGHDVYCEIRGHGDHVVFFLPGAMGTCTTDFVHQYRGFDASKFTMVTWDAPGYGNSRPPERNCKGNYYKRDADQAIRLMQVLTRVLHERERDHTEPSWPLHPFTCHSVSSSSLFTNSDLSLLLATFPALLSVSAFFA